MTEKIPFTEPDVKIYLDRLIRFWREKRDNEENQMAKYYIDAYQSVRFSLFGKLLDTPGYVPR